MFLVWSPWSIAFVTLFCPESFRYVILVSCLKRDVEIVYLSSRVDLDKHGKYSDLYWNPSRHRFRQLSSPMCRSPVSMVTFAAPNPSISAYLSQSSPTGEDRQPFSIILNRNLWSTVGEKIIPVLTNIIGPDGCADAAWSLAVGHVLLSILKGLYP